MPERYPNDDATRGRADEDRIRDVVDEEDFEDEDDLDEDDSEEDEDASL